MCGSAGQSHPPIGDWVDCAERVLVGEQLGRVEPTDAPAVCGERQGGQQGISCTLAALDGRVQNATALVVEDQPQTEVVFAEIVPSRHGDAENDSPEPRSCDREADAYQAAILSALNASAAGAFVAGERNRQQVVLTHVAQGEDVGGPLAAGLSERAGPSGDLYHVSLRNRELPKARP